MDGNIIPTDARTDSTPRSLHFWRRYLRAEWSGIKSRLRRAIEIAAEHRWQRDVSRFDSHSKFVGQWVSYNQKPKETWPMVRPVNPIMAEACHQTVKAVAEVLSRPANVEPLRKSKVRG